jgi:hypothetical protein
VLQASTPELHKASGTKEQFINKMDPAQLPNTEKNKRGGLGIKTGSRNQQDPVPRKQIGKTEDNEVEARVSEVARYLKRRIES